MHNDTIKYKSAVEWTEVEKPGSGGRGGGKRRKRYHPLGDSITSLQAHRHNGGRTTPDEPTVAPMVIWRKGTIVGCGYLFEAATGVGARLPEVGAQFRYRQRVDGRRHAASPVTCLGHCVTRVRVMEGGVPSREQEMWDR